MRGCLNGWVGSRSLPLSHLIEPSAAVHLAADQGTSRSSHGNADPAAIATGEGRSSTGTQEATDDGALNAAVVVHLFGGRRVLAGALDCGRGVAAMFISPEAPVRWSSIEHNLIPDPNQLFSCEQGQLSFQRHPTITTTQTEIRT